MVAEGFKPGLLVPDHEFLITVLYGNSKRKDFLSTSVINKLLSTHLLLLPVRNEIHNDMNKLAQIHFILN